MTCYILTNSDASFSISGEEHIDSVVYATFDKDAMDTYIKDNNITLGCSFLYDYNYEYWTIHELNVNLPK